PALLTLIEGLTAEQALWRPAPERRCIWELALHMLHWETAVAARMQERPMPGMDNPWPTLPAWQDEVERDRCWAELIAEVKRSRAELIQALKVLDPAEPYPHPDLAEVPHWIAGAGAQVHDSYHLGQVAILRAMQGLPAVE
ncbi:MAG: DinB family protein, partial [Phycisphaerales bacterium]